MSDPREWSSPDDRDRGGSPAGWVGPGWAPQQPPAGWAPQQPPPAWGQQPATAWGGPGWAQQRPPEVKPGIIPLRPLGVGEILDGAISCMRAHPRVMLGFSALVVGVTQLVQLVAVWSLLRDLSASTATFTPGASFGTVFGALADSLTATLVGGVLAFLAQTVLTGVLTVVVSRAVLGESVDARTAWARVRGRLPALLGLSLLVGVLLTGVVLLALAPGLISLALSLPTALSVLLVVLGGSVGLLAVVWLYVSFGLATPALILERQSIRAALSRSRRLVRGSWWRVCGVLLLAAILGAVIGGLVQLPFSALSGGLMGFGASNGVGATSLLALVLSAVGGTLAGTITYPFAAAVGVLLYVDQRMRREALDLELARAAGATLPERTGPAAGGPGAGGFSGPTGSPGPAPARW